MADDQKQQQQNQVGSTLANAGLRRIVLKTGARLGIGFTTNPVIIAIVLVVILTFVVLALTAGAPGAPSLTEENSTAPSVGPTEIQVTITPEEATVEPTPTLPAQP